MQWIRGNSVIPRKMLALIVILMIVSTALFVTGITIERSGRSAATSIHQDAGASSTVSHDSDGGHEPTKTPQGTQQPVGSPSETVFGLDLENPWFVAVYVLVWLALIAALFLFGRWALLVVMLVALMTVILDVGEVMRKVGESNTVVATFAILVMAAHIAIVVLALLVLVGGAEQKTAQEI